MGRERAFDEAEVLERAADAFSLHGYAGASMAVLSEATGLGKQSLYNAFGDKEALYLKAVDCATARFQVSVQRVLAAATGRVAVQIFLREIGMLCAGSNAPARVCVVSAGLLEGTSSAEVQAALERKWSWTHEFVRSQVERGQKDGSIRNRAPSTELADVVMNAMSGMRVAAKVESSRARLGASIDLLLCLFDVP